MAVSQEPKYDKPWCWTCQAHKRYKYVQTSYGGSGERTGRKTICRSCGARMWKPFLMNLGGLRLGCSLMYFVPVIGFFAFFLWSINAESSTSSTDLFLGIVVFVIFFILLPAYLLHLMARKYAVWKKWAKERGWEEDKTTAPPP